MKKSSAGVSAEEPMGIVIAMGTRVEVRPQVRAYVWGEWSPEPTSEVASSEHMVR